MEGYVSDKDIFFYSYIICILLKEKALSWLHFVQSKTATGYFKLQMKRKDIYYDQNHV